MIPGIHYQLMDGDGHCTEEKEDTNKIFPFTSEDPIQSNIELEPSTNNNAPFDANHNSSHVRTISSNCFTLLFHLGNGYNPVTFFLVGIESCCNGHSYQDVTTTCPWCHPLSSA
jgi:hypothetical protein